MKAISLWQPWATAMAVGVKKNETRGWATNYRGPLVIHAAKTPLSTVCRELGEDQETMHAWMQEFVGVPWSMMPLGALLCVVRVIDCVRTELVFDDDTPADDPEWVLGNYEPGRYAWVTDSVKVFDAHIPWKGSQGFFDVPDEIVKQALQQAVTP